MHPPCGPFAMSVRCLSLLVLGVIVASVLAPAPAAADSATPVRVAVQCETAGRTKACPAFLLGIVDANRVLANAPRAAADVVVYANATEVALVDRVQLRFVSTLTGAPRELAISVDLDTRATDDEQRAALTSAFLRGVALFVAARHPDAVTVALTEPHGLATAPKHTTPWGVRLSMMGSGSRTGRFRKLDGGTEASVERISRRFAFKAAIAGGGSVQRQPPLVLEDGSEVSLDAEQWSYGGGTGAAWLLDDTWSFGALTELQREDPNAQFRHRWLTRAGVEWDRYPANDPRGNRLALTYAVGFVTERYNIANEIGERDARYPLHELLVSGSLRRDTVSFQLYLKAGAQMLKPSRRYDLVASPSVEIQIGKRVDLSMSLSLTKRELPGPDLTMIDPSDFQIASRLSYAEPLSLTGSLSLSIHWDPTNGERNDRFKHL